MRWHRPAILHIRLSGRKKRAVFAVLPFLSLLVSFSNARGQSLPLPPWDVLAEESAVVVVGEVLEGQLWVISPEKLAKAEVTPDGKPTLPNPSEFVFGILSRVQVKEVIKSDGKLKPGSTVSVFVYGYGGSDSPHVLLEKEKCVLFIGPLGSNNKDFAHARIVRPRTLGSPEKHARFDPKRCYTPVREGFGQVILTPQRMQIVEDIEKAIAKRP